VTSASNTPSQTPNPASIITGTLADEFAKRATLINNVDGRALLIGVDRLELCVSKHHTKLEQAKDWQTPAGLVLAILATFATTEFRDYGFKKNTWEAIFFVVGVLCGLWLIRSIPGIWTKPKVESLMKELIAGSSPGTEAK